ncbi:MAG TPA: hypothetical protein HPP76_09070 [Desulfuromonadales bacterium]|nr:hypothetical protein [Desulfuromonadales bacterium]
MNHVIFRILIVVFLTYCVTGHASAKPVCVNATGESAIIAGDVPSAKVEAINRAKWAAVEEVSGVDVKSKTIVEDSALLDDLITTQTRGVVNSFKVLKEQRQGDSIKTLINVCIETVNATAAMSSLSLNTAISVYLPARRLYADGQQEYDDENIVVQNIIGKLAEQGFSVRDLAESQSFNMKDIDMALKNGDQVKVRSLVYRFLSSSVLIGKIEPTISKTKGSNAGYGISMPFNAVTARLTYRLMTRDTSGKMVVLAAGSEEAKGLASSTEDAYAEALKNVAEKFIPIIVAKINSRLSELSNKVNVRIEGIKTPSETFTLREQLQKVSWVTKVEEVGLGEFAVSFPENSIYLASGMTQKGFKILSFNRDSIKARRP